jgi:hypothetical protein
MIHVWKKSSSSANEIHYVPIERERERERERTNDQGSMSRIKEITPRPEKKKDIQTRAEPVKTQGKGRSQRSNPKPSPNTTRRLKDQERPQRSAMLGQYLSSKPQAQAMPYRKDQLVHTGGEEAQNQGQTPQRHYVMSWLDTTREAEIKSMERSISINL